MDKAGLHKGFWNGKLLNGKATNLGKVWGLRGFSALVFTVMILLAVLALSASLTTQIPDQVLPVNSSSELNLSAYFPEFQENVF